eukprot:2629148-Rhodomonas_salina.1
MLRLVQKLPVNETLAWLKTILRLGHLNINQCKENQEDEDEAKFSCIKESLGKEPENISYEDRVDDAEYHEYNLFSPKTYSYNHVILSTDIVVPWSSVPHYQIENIHNLTESGSEWRNVQQMLGTDPVELGLVETVEQQAKRTGDGGVTVDDDELDDVKGGDEAEAPDFQYVSAEVWEEGCAPLAMAACKDDEMSYQAMIVLVSDTPDLLEIVKASQQHKVLQAIECSLFWSNTLEIPAGLLF